MRLAAIEGQLRRERFGGGRSGDDGGLEGEAALEGEEGEREAAGARGRLRRRGSGQRRWRGGGRERRGGGRDEGRSGAVDRGRGIWRGRGKGGSGEGVSS